MIQRVNLVHQGHRSCEKSPTQLNNSFTARDVANVVNKMVSGQSLGYDYHSIERLRYAGGHMQIFGHVLFIIIDPFLLVWKSYENASRAHHKD